MKNKLDLGNHLKLINDTNFKGKSIRGDDNKFMEIDDQLYALIEQAFEINTDKIPDIIGTYNDYTTNIEMG